MGTVIVMQKGRAVKRIGLGALVAVMLLPAACAEELPTAVGGSLTEGALRTFEVIIGPTVFLASDTTFGGLVGTGTVAFRIVAEDFEGQLNAHTLIRHTAPTAVTYTDSTDNETTDSIPQFVGAKLLLEVDTLASTAPAGSTMELYSVVEEWDAGSASWAFRIDTGGVQLPWTQPGGTPGSLLGSTTYDPVIPDTATIDTLTIDIDSASAVVLADTLSVVDGVMLMGGNGGTRYRLRSSRLFFLVRPLAAQDTILEIAATQSSAFVYDPQPGPTAGAVVRIGGFPGWRSVYRFRPIEDLELDLGQDCGLADCMVPIGSVTMNYAALVLEPSYAGGFRPELPPMIQALDVLESPGVPLVRSPLGTTRRGLTEGGVPVDKFSATPADPSPVDIPVTGFVRRLVDPDLPVEERSTVLALLPHSAGATFGFAEFRSAQTATPPRLRLIVSVVNPERIQ